MYFVSGGKSWLESSLYFDCECIKAIFEEDYCETLPPEICLVLKNDSEDAKRHCFHLGWVIIGYFTNTSRAEKYDLINAIREIME